MVDTIGVVSTERRRGDVFAVATTACAVGSALSSAATPVVLSGMSSALPQADYARPHPRGAPPV